MIHFSQPQIHMNSTTRMYLQFTLFITHFYEIIRKGGFDSYNFRLYVTGHYENHEPALIGVQWSRTCTGKM